MLVTVQLICNEWLIRTAPQIKKKKKRSESVDLRRAAYCSTSPHTQNGYLEHHQNEIFCSLARYQNFQKISLKYIPRNRFLHNFKQTDKCRQAFNILGRGHKDLLVKLSQNVFI